MKKIVFEGVEYLYVNYSSPMVGDETIFYLGVEEHTSKKYWFFGKKITKVTPKEVFRIDYDIESGYLSKEQVKAAILQHVLILKRREEIKNNEII